MLNNLLPQPPKMPQLTSIQSILAAGAARGKHKGWRAKELGAVEHGRRNKRFNILLREDTKEMLGFLSGRSTAGGGTGGPTRRHNNGSTIHNKKGRNGCFSKRAIKHDPHTLAYLAKAWGVGKNFPMENLKKGAASTEPEQTTNPTQLSIIDSLEAAKIHFSAKSLFISNHISGLINEETVFAYESTAKKERVQEFRELAKAEWVLAEPKVVDFWEAQS
jgi:hypothetical protein